MIQAQKDTRQANTYGIATHRYETHRFVAFLLIAFFLVSPFDTIPPLRWIAPQLSAEWVDIIQLPFIILGFLLLLRERRQLRLPLWGAEFLIIAGSLIALTQASNLAESVETLLKDLYMFLFFIMIVNLVREKGLLLKLIKIWQVLAIIQASLIIFSFIINGGKPAVRYEQQAIEQGLEIDGGIQERHLIKRQVLRAQGIFAPGRQTGTFANSNLAGLYLAAGAILIVGMPLTRKRWLNMLYFGIVVFGLILTGSNATLGACAVGLLFYLLLNNSLRSQLIWLGLGVVAIGIALGAYVMVATSQISSTVISETSHVIEQGVGRIPGSIESRLRTVETGWRQFREQPMGLAPHGMRESIEERNVHNDYAAYLYERGFLGFAGLLLLLGGAAVKAIYSGLNGDDEHRRLMAILLGVLVVTIVTELVHEYMREREVWLVMAMIVLLADFEMNRRQTQKHVLQARRWPWVILGSMSMSGKS